MPKRRFWPTAVCGDAAVFVLFAFIGRSQHGESSGPWDTLMVAVPFFAAWFLVAAFRGMYRPAITKSVTETARLVGLNWLLAWPLSLLFRAAFQHRGIPASFDIVVLIVNAALLVSWRIGLAIVTSSTHFGKP